MFYIVASQVKINHMTKMDNLFSKPLNNNLVIVWRGGVGLILYVLYTNLVMVYINSKLIRRGIA
jgi:hypothetical protein